MENLFNLIQDQIIRLTDEPNYSIPMDIEIQIQEESGYVRGWDHITQEYTESQLEWLDYIGNEFKIWGE